MTLQPSGSLFSAVSASARQLALLLRCMSFASKAQVKISPDGLRFSAERGSVMEGESIDMCRILFITVPRIHTNRASICIPVQIAVLEL